MATPSENSLDVSWISSSQAGSAKALIYGSKWGSSQLGQGLTITWSIPKGTAYFDNPYSYYDEPESWYSLSSVEIASASRAMRVWADVSGLRTRQVSDTRFEVGEIRFAKSSYVDNSSDAHAYLPATLPRGGDVWFNVESWNETGQADTPGSYDYHTVLHEIGHALGLKHPFESSSYNSTKLAFGFDSYFHTIMSYTVKPGLGTSGYADFYPTTPMYLDLLAIQYLYGTDTATRSGNTVYKFAAGRKYWEAIHDGGGTDTIVYQGSANASIDLRPGRFSSLSDPITFSDGTSTRSTVTIGPGVVIEKAVGGSGSDTLIGNTANNILRGNAGLDRLSGGSGNDYLYGGVNNDSLTGGPGKDAFVFDTKPHTRANVDRILDFNVRDDTIRLDDAIFRGLKRGTLKDANFHIGSKAKDSKDKIVYKKSSGELFYDRDGSGPGEQIKFATLKKGLKLTHDDFLII